MYNLKKYTCKTIYVTVLVIHILKIYDCSISLHLCAMQNSYNYYTHIYKYIYIFHLYLINNKNRKNIAKKFFTYKVTLKILLKYQKFEQKTNYWAKWKKLHKNNNNLTWKKKSNKIKYIGHRNWSSFLNNCTTSLNEYV